MRKGVVCRAKTRAGGKCQRRPNSTGRCKLHGGASRRGPDSPTCKHGRRSKYVRGGKRLQAAYAAALNDPELTSMKVELAALDAIVAGMASGLEGVDRQALAKLQANQAEIPKAVRSDDEDWLKAALAEQDKLITRCTSSASGSATRQTWPRSTISRSLTSTSHERGESDADSDVVLCRMFRSTKAKTPDRIRGYAKQIRLLRLTAESKSAQERTRTQRRNSLTRQRVTTIEVWHLARNPARLAHGTRLCGC
jgi:hypothetical protein